MYALHKIAGHALLTWTGKHLPCVWEAKYLPLDDGKRGYYTVRPRDISLVTIRSAAIISHPSQSSCRGGRPRPPLRAGLRKRGLYKPPILTNISRLTARGRVRTPSPTTGEEGFR